MNCSAGLGLPKVSVPSLFNFPVRRCGLLAHRFEQEAKTLAGLNHPNILTVHDAGIHHEVSYLVSELLEGRTSR
jgi:serine/threonine protein kinase